MAKLLYVESSPRKERSHSIRAARVFLDAYREAHAEDEIETLDLWTVDLPPFDGFTLDAKYAIMHGKEHTEEQRAAWSRVTELADKLKGADKLVFSLPMWNFGVPYRLKHFIDVVTQPTVTFNVTKEGKYEGLLTGRPVVAIYASGGAYSTGTGAESLDFQRSYMELWLGFVGLSLVNSIVVEPTMAGPEKAEESQEKAAEEAKRIAKEF